MAREKSHGFIPFTPTSSTITLATGAYYLESISATYERSYKRLTPGSAGLNDVQVVQSQECNSSSFDDYGGGLTIDGDAPTAVTSALGALMGALGFGGGTKKPSAEKVNADEEEPDDLSVLGMTKQASFQNPVVMHISGGSPSAGTPEQRSRNTSDQEQESSLFTSPIGTPRPLALVGRNKTQIWASGRPMISVVVTGIAAALPGRDRDVFPDVKEGGLTNVQRIIAGEMFISPIPEAVKDKMLEKNIVKLSKNKGRALV